LTENLQRRFAITKGAPLIVASSTHTPEEQWILQAFKKVYKSSPENPPRLLIAPRHPERFAEVEKLVKETGFDWAKRSETESSRDRSAKVILLDSIGELRAIYSLAEIVFVGGSLIPHGGQSILEPAIAEKPIVTGFYTMNFEAATKEFLNQNALIQLPKLAETEVVEKLAETFSQLLQNQEARQTLAKNALAVMRKNRGATEKTIEQLKPFLQNSRTKTFSQNNQPDAS
jgi:3-deoxy-D-manno-octulosonic-acid transferase